MQAVNLCPCFTLALVKMRNQYLHLACLSSWPFISKGEGDGPGAASNNLCLKNKFFRAVGQQFSCFFSPFPCGIGETAENSRGCINSLNAWLQKLLQS